MFIFCAKLEIRRWNEGSAAMAKKRLALFLDGSWNDTADNTNVRRLYDMMALTGADGLEQKPYYSEGVGTARGEEVRGGIYGYGLDEDVRNAYRWLVRNYEDDDEIFIFGFSRGAFTARTLCGIIVRCGLLYPGAPLSIEQVWKRYTVSRELHDLWLIKYKLKNAADRPDIVLTEEDRRLADCSRRVPIEMIGVWDTVGSMGIPLANIPIIGKNEFRFHNTNPSKLMRNGFHAMALDEHRLHFDVTMWNKFVPTVPQEPLPGAQPDPNIEQRWFPGAHSNIGGGIANSYMAQVPLNWLQKKAIGLGLTFKSKVRLRGGEHLAEIHKSLDWKFRLLQFGQTFNRTIAPKPVRKTSEKADGTVHPINVTIDATVFDRWHQDSDYRPAPLDSWLNENGLDVSTIRHSAAASAGGPVP
jgi:uncharacterized protein (DUF2235 family)